MIFAWRWLRLVSTVSIVGVAALYAFTATGGEPAGKSDYLQYCSACHGDDGTGNGPVAESFKKPIPDLTKLASRYGTPLPRAELIEIIDGRQLAHAHGHRGMPVWGKRLYGGIGSSEKDGRIRGTILIILDYLQSLQEVEETSR